MTRAAAVGHLISAGFVHFSVDPLRRRSARYPLFPSAAARPAWATEVAWPSTGAPAPPQRRDQAQLDHRRTGQTIPDRLRPLASHEFLVNGLVCDGPPDQPGQAHTERLAAVLWNSFPNTVRKR